MKVGVVGAGWAGLAAACSLARNGHRLVVWETAPQVGGRARSALFTRIPAHASRPDPAEPEVELDCGQHVLIGAYTACLELMRTLGVDEDSALMRHPLTLVDAQGSGLRLPSGPPAVAFIRALWSHSGWTAADKWAMLAALLRWRLRGFQAPPHQTVADCCAHLPRRVYAQWAEPLCVAALNTPASQASAAVFLRVLADGLFAGTGGSDLLIPRRPLHELLGGPALATLTAAAADIRLRRRVQAIKPGSRAGAWVVDDTEVDRLVVACTSREAARLLQPWDAQWAEQADRLQHESIATTWVHSEGSTLCAPMVSLHPPHAGLTTGPAQFVFDLGAIGHPWKGGFAFVSSAAALSAEGGVSALESAVMTQAMHTPGLHWHVPPRLVRTVVEKRATFLCEPGMTRPAARAAPAHGGVVMAGDYIDGPYPSTLEGAVRSGLAAAQAVQNS